MTSDENSPSSPIVEHTESSAQVQSLPTIIVMPPNSSPSTSSIRSSKKELSKDNHSEFPRVSSGKRAAAKEISMRHLRHRLCVRELFIARLTLVSNIMSFLAVFSIVLMVIENELTFDRVDNKDTKTSWSIKLVISLTTVILIGLIFYYHYLDMSLYAYRNLLNDWRVQLTCTKILWITIEILICIIHPMPRSYPYTDPEKINSDSAEFNSTSSTPYSMSYTAVDVGLGLPMFLRLYLLGRSIMIHSPLVRDLPLRSLGYLNHVSIDSYFLIKAHLEHWPIPGLLTFGTIVFLIGSWSLRACDYTPTREHVSLSDSMWLFIITFTTIGYGDEYPTTYCGRSVAAIIGLIGLLLSALIIAIIAQKLHLTQEEKYVHAFVLNTQLARKYKKETANVIKFAVKSWYLKRHDKSASIQYFQVQRKLFRSIHCFQKIKQRQRNLVDSCVGFAELMAKQRHTSMQSDETVEEIVAIKTEMKQIKEEIKKMSRNMNTLQNTLSGFLDKLA